MSHLQSKLSALEEQLDEARAHAETEAEQWRARLDKAKQGEREKGESVRELQGEMKRLNGEMRGAKGRVGEMESALGEVRAALEGARGEIEGLRGEAAVSFDFMWWFGVFDEGCLLSAQGVAEF